MKRYFLELGYKGARYSGFQIQQNAVTVQFEVEKALELYFRQKIELTGSSRTDAGVHAIQNYFHFDFDGEVPEGCLYNINAILPGDIAVRSLREVITDGDEPAHSRFTALAREYKYYIYREKNPFLDDRAFFYPYKLTYSLLERAADLLKEHTDFTTFSKRNTQVKTFQCRIMESVWMQEGECLVYRVKSNRFLRGMVRGMVGTMLQVGRGKITPDEFDNIISARDCTLADFSVPAHGLFLAAVEYPKNIFR
ncbi:MAG TPA: tRNA pseudouridine(38-40) synthase TruA [Chitinophagaceae bacterium]